MPEQQHRAGFSGKRITDRVQQDRERWARLADATAADQASERAPSISRDAFQQPRNADVLQQPSNISDDDWNAVLDALIERIDDEDRQGIAPEADTGMMYNVSIGYAIQGWLEEQRRKT